MKASKAIRIDDTYVLQRIETVRQITGEKTATATARRMILERAAQLDPERRVDRPQPATTAG